MRGRGEGRMRAKAGKRGEAIRKRGGRKGTLAKHPPNHTRTHVHMHTRAREYTHKHEHTHTHIHTLTHNILTHTNTCEGWGIQRPRPDPLGCARAWGVGL